MLRSSLFKYDPPPNGATPPTLLIAIVIPSIVSVRLHASLLSVNSVSSECTVLSVCMCVVLRVVSFLVV